MPDFGRMRMGISCVGTGFVIIRIGPDSAVCQNLGKCEQWQLSTLTEGDVNWVQANFPAQVPLKHKCTKHKLGWYNANYVPPGVYLAVAQAGSGLFGLFDGHGTMDTYAYTGNGGAWQNVNCPRPVVRGDGICGAGERCACDADCGECNPSSCIGVCGGYAGECACDNGCNQRGDCCEDACSNCGACGWGNY